MKYKEVLVSNEAIKDLEESRNFFEALEQGLGSYFFDCMLVDIESLKFFGGIHYKEFGFYRMNSKNFPILFIMI